MSELNKSPKEYQKDELTVFWDQTKCTHSANCVKGLPGVFNIEAKPWINMDGATKDEIRAQVAKCPSGALSIKE